jgi:hypothetical protein
MLDLGLEWGFWYCCLFFPFIEVVRIEVHTAVNMKNTFIWDEGSCSLTEVYKRFGGTYHLHLQVEK